MTSFNPELLPKVHSPALLKAIEGMPCTLRIASFIPGFSCAPQDTVVPCHLPTIGKGMGTKVSDLFVVAGCLHCHNLIDARDKRWHDLICDHPVPVYQRILRALSETQTLLVEAGIIRIKGSKAKTRKAFKR
jgi:hypothetical protein